MSEEIMHDISRVAEHGTPILVHRRYSSDELPTVADLVLPGTGHTFSGEFACLLRVLAGERESA